MKEFTNIFLSILFILFKEIRTPGITPQAPAVGQATIFPMEALASETVNDTSMANLTISLKKIGL